MNGSMQIIVTFFKPLPGRLRRAWGRIRGNLEGEHREAYAWLYAFILAAFLTLVVLSCFNRTYDYADDLTQRDYLRSGMISPFSGHIFSLVVNFLYQCLSFDFPWYSVSLLIIKFCTLVVCVYLILIKEYPIQIKGAFGVLFLVFFIPFLIRFSWNTTSVLAGAVAAVGLLDSLLPDKKPGVVKALLLGCLAAVSYSIRRDGIMMTALDVLPPLGAYILFLSALKKIKLWKVIFYGAIFMAPLLVVLAEDQNFIKNGFTPAERLHDTAQEARAPVYGYGVYGHLTSSLSLMEANGWTANDVYLIAYGMTLFDENKFAPERFWNVLNEEIGPGEQAIKRDLVYNWLHFGQLENFKWFDPNYEAYKSFPYYIAMLACFIFVAWGGKTVIERLFGAGYLGFMYLTTIYLVNYLKFPWYLSHPVYLIFCLILFCSIKVDIKRFTQGIANKITAGLCLCLVAVSLMGMTRDILALNTEITEKRSHFFQLYADFQSRFGNDAFIFIRPQLYLEYFTDPLYLGEQGPETNYAVLGVGSAAFSPIFYEYIQSRLGLDYGYQLLPWMINNPKAFFLSRDTKMAQWVKTFIFETYGVWVNMHPVFTYADGLRAYQIDEIEKNLPIYSVVNQFINEFDSATIQSDDPANVHTSQFTIKGLTQPVLFEHPDSQVSYQVIIPLAAKLRFSIAVSSEAWAKEGDGVQYHIYIAYQNTKEQVFSQYIDPKKNLNQQQWHDYELDLSRWEGKKVTLTFETLSGPNNDARFDWAGWGNPTLGQYTYFDFTRKLYTAYPPPASLDQTRIIRRLVDGSYKNILYQHPDGWLSYPLHIQPDTQLAFGIGLDPEVWSPEKGDGVRFEVLVTDGSRTVQVFNQYLDPKNVEEDRHWFYEWVDLSEFADRDVKITFVTRPGSNEEENNKYFDWAYWVAPRLVQDGTSEK